MIRLQRNPTAALLALALLSATSWSCDSNDKPAVDETPPPEKSIVEEKVVIVEGKAEPRTMSDDAIVASITRRLLFDLPGVTAAHVHVASKGGGVELSGRVDTLVAADRVEAIAEETRGVRSVSNKIEVEPSDVADDVIEANVEANMIAMPAMVASKVTTSADEGVVTLTGEVDSWTQRAAAERAARMAAGVRKVDNQITVTLKSWRSDEEIRDDVETVLTQDLHLDAGRIAVSVDDGQVILGGAVGSLAEARHARELSWVAGAKAVHDDDLAVEWWRHNEMVKPPPAIDDDEKAELITDALQRDPRVDPERIEVHVVGQRAQLGGIVTTAAARQVAEDITRGFRPIWQVDNQIRVEPSASLTDPLLEKRVEEALKRNAWVAGDEPAVEVVGGVATLRGEVVSDLAADSAVRTAESVAGIRKVKSELTAAEYSSPRRSDQEIADTIASDLLFQPRIDSANIRVTVSAGKVTLSGEVSQRFMIETAAQIARDAGAIRVVNNLETQ